MKILYKVVVVVLVLIAELYVLELFNPWPHGMAFDVSYRHEERVAAYMDYHDHPSPATEATWRQELSLLHRHEDWKVILAGVLLLVINGVAIYCYFRYGNRKAAAS